MQSARNHSTRHTLWLQQQSSAIRSQQGSILLLRLIQIIAQLGCFWLFADIMHGLIIDKSPVANQLWIELAGLAALYIVFTHLSERARLACQSHTEKQLRNEIEKHWERSQMALTRRFSPFFWQLLMLEQIPAIARYLSQYAVQKWLAGLSPIIILLAIFPVNYVVGLVLLITMPIVPLFMIIVGKGAASLHRKHFSALERLGHLFADRLKGLTLLTATHRHQSQQHLLSVASDAVNQRTMKVVSVAFLSTSVLDFFATVSMALIAVFIGFSLLGEISFGPPITFQQGLYMLLVAPMLFAEMKTLGHMYHQKAQADAASEATYTVLSEPLPDPVKGHFEGINWINFSLDEPRLTASHLYAQPGDRIRLEGASGAGKTVFMEALMGLRASSHKLVSRCAMLTQSPVILPTTVRDNLSMGQSISEQQLWQCLDKVQLKNWATHLEHGLDTEMGDYPPLSGGEAQRLALARILLQEADFVLLDEPTANLTDEQHNLLLSVLQDNLGSKTLLWASHKPLPHQWFTRTWSIADATVHCQ